MNADEKANFIKNYEPGKKAKILLKNMKILDVKESRYLAQGTEMVIAEGKIQSMPDQTIDSPDQMI